MAQHFLLSAKARTISLKSVYQMGEDKAYSLFCQLRWPDTEGAPVCPCCGCLDHYSLTARRQFECRACKRHFSVTSGTILSNRKMAFTDSLAAIVLFVNGAKGVSALQISRDLDCQYKTAYVLCHKLREAMAIEDKGRVLSGDVEVDGAYFGGYVKPANVKAERKDLRLFANRTGKRLSVVVGRERGGQSLTLVARSEALGGNEIVTGIHHMATVHADEASHWDDLHARFDTRRINHSVAYSTGEACTNQAESFFSRLRRMEIGTHHHIAGPYLAAYASEASWREDNRRVDNGSQAMTLTAAAMDAPVSRGWKGYWQRNAA